MALLSTATGVSAITETVFEQRFWQVDELRKMGRTSLCEAGPP
jgi:UDP-N-acetylglucosamine 1-carboxyvinyltransferase